MTDAGRYAELTKALIAALRETNKYLREFQSYPQFMQRAAIEAVIFDNENIAVAAEKQLQS